MFVRANNNTRDFAIFEAQSETAPWSVLTHVPTAQQPSFIGSKSLTEHHWTFSQGFKIFTDHQTATTDIKTVSHCNAFSLVVMLQCASKLDLVAPWLVTVFLQCLSALRPHPLGTFAHVELFNFLQVGNSHLLSSVPVHSRVT